MRESDLIDAEMKAGAMVCIFKEGETRWLEALYPGEDFLSLVVETHAQFRALWHEIRERDFYQDREELDAFESIGSSIDSILTIVAAKELRQRCEAKELRQRLGKKAPRRELVVVKELRERFGSKENAL